MLVQFIDDSIARVMQFDGLIRHQAEAVLKMRESNIFLSSKDAGASRLQIQLSRLRVLTGFAPARQLLERLSRGGIVSIGHQSVRAL
jgi:hypothetical protein